MLLKETEFTRDKYTDIQIISNTDSGLFAVQYEQVGNAGQPKVQTDRYASWHYDSDNEYYSLVVPKQEPRKVLRSVMVARTSTNHYEIAYADALGCVFESTKSLTEVHELLTPLWKRKLKQ